MVLGVVGDLLEDVVVRLAEPIRRGADAPAVITRRPGGSAANVAVAAAGLGAPVRLVTAVGDDRLGRSLVAAAEAAGVDVRARRTARTGSVVVVVEPDGERTMYPDRAAAADVRLDPEGSTDLSLVHVPAYGLLPPPGHPGPLGPLAEDLRRVAAPLAVDVSSVQVVEALGPALEAELGALRPVVVLANADEATALGWWPGRPPAALTVVVKRGPAPALVLADGLVIEVPAEEAGPVPDSTGAGDAFAAGYLVAVLAGHHPPAAAAAGHRAAARHLRSRST